MPKVLVSGYAPSKPPAFPIVGQPVSSAAVKTTADWCTVLNACDGDLAYRLFLDMLRSYAKPPFYAMSETPANNRFVFLSAEGAFLQQILFGFTGLRFSQEGLTAKYPPLLPPTWQSLELRNISIKGRKHSVRIEQGGKLELE